MKKIAAVPTFFLLLLAFTQVLGQTIATQNSVKLFFEKVFLHTDRNIYAPGEDIWYKAYVINGQDNHLTGTSKNLCVELIAPDNTIIKKEIAFINKGTGKGDFALAGNLPGGSYRLRAYTNWQRNFGDNFIFEKSITVVAHGQKAAANAATTKPLPGNSTTPAANAAFIRFFPEGGSLINEVPSIVAVKAEDAGGKGISVSGPVLSATGDTVARFSTDTLGMGAFVLLPRGGQSYHSVVKYSGQTINATIPVALNSGLGLKVQKRDTLIYITISTNAAGALAFTGKPFTLSIKHAGTAYITRQIQLNDNIAIIKLPENLLPEGIAAITVYDDTHKPNAERLVYITHTNNKAAVTVTVQKPVYKPREQVTVNIKAGNGNKPLSGNFSLAAVDASVNVPEASNILAYIMLQSDIRGQIEQPARYFDTTNVNRAKQLDMLMLTQGWRDFVWQRLADTAIAISYLPEQGFTISGSVKNGGDKPVPNANVTLSAPKATGQKLMAARTDEKGIYYFDNLQLTGPQPIGLTTRDDKGKPNGIIHIDSLFKNGLPVTGGIKKSDDVITPNLTDDISRRVSSVKTLDSITNLREVKIKANSAVIFHDQPAVSFGYPDEVLTVTAEDLSFKRLRDYIMYKSHLAKPDPSNNDQLVFFADGKTYHPRIVVDNRELFFGEDDDDQVQADYYTTYYNLPMEQVEKVVIKRFLAGMKPPSASKTATTNIFGASVVQGAAQLKPENLFVIYLTLKPGAFFKDGRGITSATVNGYYEQRNFYKPIHSGGGYDPAKPDLRNTIHWEPEIKTDSSGRATVTFYNADPKTNVRIIVQGISDSGEPLSGVKMYTVK